jgi:transketolase
MALESLKVSLKQRFVNVGVCEQNMISLAAGLASEGFRPICYSIAPFVVFRPAEQIRLDVCLHDFDVKIIGNGGGYGYGIMGPTHHAIEDLAVLSPFRNMECYIPFFNEGVPDSVMRMMERRGPAYLRLGMGIRKERIFEEENGPLPRLLKGNDLTIVSCGPTTLNVYDACQQTKVSADLFALTQIPLLRDREKLLESLTRTKRLLVVEEHVERGGVGELISKIVLASGIHCKNFKHIFAVGYPDGLYGSQNWHLEKSGLSVQGITRTLLELLEGVTPS